VALRAILEARQDVNADIIVPNKSPVLCGDSLPGRFGCIARFPDQAAAFVEAFERICVRERLGVAAQYHIHMIQLAIDADWLGGDDEIIMVGAPFFSEPYFGLAMTQAFPLFGRPHRTWDLDPK